jgi:succinate dehydrogenase / fumarate reductase flavoprotein subunit
MQGLADGYFVIPTTIANYLVTQKPGSVTTEHPEFKKALEDCTAQTNASSTSRASAAWTASTANSACSSGTSAAWPATREGLTEAIKNPRVA